MKKINLTLPHKSYPIYILLDLTNSEDNPLKKWCSENKTFWIIDENVFKLYREYLLTLVPDISETDIFIYKASESSKNLKTIEDIFNGMLKAGLDRKSTVVAFGGGITGDITGYAASGYMRGIKYVQVPTTLLSAVDSSVGGKTGVNLGGRKNIIGAFYQPEMVVINTAFFKTLPQEELVCGIGEAVKYGFLTGDEFFVNETDKFLALDDEALSTLVEKSVCYKADVVAHDEKEAGLRKVLNLGHTFGHSFEAYTNYKIKHGQAVILGIVAALKLALVTGIAEDNYVAASLNFMQNLKQYIPKLKLDSNESLELMRSDKKNTAGNINLVLPVSNGEVCTDFNCDDSLILEAIDYADEWLNKAD